MSGQTSEQASNGQAAANGRAAAGRADGTADGQAFVELFATAWREGRHGFDADWVEHFHEDVVLTQPLAPPARGHDGFRELFDTLFGAIPDLTGEVLDWRPTEAGVDIDVRLSGTFAGVPVTWVSHDRFVIEDGRVRARHASFNPLPLVRAVARRPHAGVPLLLSARGGRARGPASSGLDRALAGLAVGRIVLGTASRVAPRGVARAFGVGAAGTPELDYMTRIFGARAIALGSGWLLSSGGARSLSQRLAFGVDVSDTVAGIGHLRRGDVPRAAALKSVALTGTYMLIGAAKVARDLRRTR